MKYSISSIPRMGTHSRDALVVQTALKEAGENVGTLDGMFFAKSVAAVSSFQKKHGLAGSGLIGPKTLALLGITVLAVSPVNGVKTITQDLKGKQDRNLNPAMRIMLESVVFPGGVVPEFIKKGEVQKSYAYVMRQMASLGIEEHGGNNRGTEVGYIQDVTGPYTEGGNGDAWCNDYSNCGIALLEDYWQVESPIIGSAHCMTTFRAAQKVDGLVSKEPEEGTLALGKRGKTDNGHSMPTLRVLPNEKMETSEGNTSFENMTDGGGSGIKIRHQFKNGDLVTQGWVRLYPNNKLPKKVG